jgi:hypothetical protein
MEDGVLMKAVLKPRLNTFSALHAWFMRGARFSAIWMQARLNGYEFLLENGISAVLYRFSNRKVESRLKSMEKHEWFPRNKEIKDRYILQLNCGETPMYLYFMDDISLADVIQMMRFPQKSLRGIQFLGDEQGWYRCAYDGGKELAFAMEKHVDLKVITLLYG